MTADVNVTEKAAWLVFEDQERHRGVGGQVVRSIEPIHYRVARAALAALADPEVLAGIAGVLREHGYAGHDADDMPPLDFCRCGLAGIDHTDHQAAAVVEWLTGERP